MAGRRRLFRFVIIPRDAPVAMLWHALGQQTAGRLPGLLGNLLVSQGDVAAVGDAIEDVFRSVDVRAAVERGYQLCAEEVDRWRSSARQSPVTR